MRGTPAHFPALLEPLLTTPIWLLNDAETAYRLTQALHVVAMSVAAIPIYWLARRVGAPAWQAVCLRRVHDRRPLAPLQLLPDG